MNTESRLENRTTGRRKDSGIALVLVMLLLLVMSVLSASIIMTTQAEVFASYNYRVSTQADYLAKAGIQRAMNWLRSPRYQAVSQRQAGSYYGVTSTGDPYNLWTSNDNPVKCLSSSASATLNGPVQLAGISGSGTTNYPLNTVAANFAADLVNVRVTGDSNKSGMFSISATLLDYQTVNIGTGTGVTATPLETWLITSRASWTGCSTVARGVATVEEEAVVQPIYLPSYGNSLYGYCSVSMQGSAGVCTDAFNSDLGAYGGGNPTVASGGCDANAANVIKAGAGVGANGKVTLSSNIVVSGNVAIGTGPSAGCATPYGFFGSTSSVLGQVVNGPHVDPPTPPTFRTGFPTGAPSFTLGSNNTTVLPSSATWPSLPPFPNVGNSPPLASHSPCMNSDGTCDGSASHHYEISSVSMSGGGSGSNAPHLQLVGGPDIFHPVYYDIGSFGQNQGKIEVSGYVVINIKTSFSIGGQGVTTGISCSSSPCTNVPPAAVQVNAACSGSCIGLGGNGASGMVLTASNADVTLGGGGSGGYFIGAIKANNISVQGGYSVHYDVQLNRASGVVGQMVTTGYIRKRL